MVIKGIEKLKNIKKLNVRACKDEEGWHLDIWKVPEGISFRSREFWKRRKENIIVDLAKENNCTTADEVRNIYDELMKLYYTKELHEKLGVKYINNGFHSICPEVDTREVNLKLTSWQLELIQDGVIGAIDSNLDFDWDISNPNNKEEFELLNMIYFTKKDKEWLNRFIKEKRYLYLNPEN